MDLVLEVVNDSTFSVLLLDHGFWAVDGVFSLVVIDSFALSLASTSASVTSNLGFDLSVLFHSCDWVNIGHFLDSLDFIIIDDDFSFLSCIQISWVVKTKRLSDNWHVRGVEARLNNWAGTHHWTRTHHWARAHNWTVVVDRSVVHSSGDGCSIDSSSSFTAVASASASAVSFTFCCGLDFF